MHCRSSPSPLTLTWHPVASTSVQVLRISFTSIGGCHPKTGRGRNEQALNYHASLSFQKLVTRREHMQVKQWRSLTTFSDALGEAPCSFAPSIMTPCHAKQGLPHFGGALASKPHSPNEALLNRSKDNLTFRRYSLDEVKGPPCALDRLVQYDMSSRACCRDRRR